MEDTEPAKEIVEENKTTSLLLEILACHETREKSLLDEVKALVQAALGQGSWTQATDKSINGFFDSKTKDFLFIWKDDDDTFILSHAIDKLPIAMDRDIFYLAKKSNQLQITSFNFSDLTLSGSITFEKFRYDVLTHMKNLESELLCQGSHLKEFVHHVVVSSISLRSEMAGCERLLVPSENWSLGSKKLSQDEFVVERIEKAVIQWIDVFESSIKFPKDALQNVPGQLQRENLHDEIAFWTNRERQLFDVLAQLDQKECQKMKSILKLSDSVLVDELSVMQLNLQEHAHHTQLTLKYLTSLVKPLDKVKSSEVNEIPQLYNDIIDLVFVIARHAPAYATNRSEAVCRLISLVGNDIVGRLAEDIEKLLDTFFKGRTEGMLHACDSISECVQICCSICEDAINMHRTHRGNLEWEIVPDLVLSNFTALQNRMKHIGNIGRCLELFGKFNEGVPFSLESNIGDILKVSHERFYQQLLPKIIEGKRGIVDVHNLTWHGLYKSFQSDVDEIEMKLVNSFEKAIDNNSTIWGKAEVVTFFKLFYEQPLFTAAMDSAANSIFKLASQEAKSVCKMDRNLWRAPVGALLHTGTSNTCMAAQRARGYIDKIAKLLHKLDWVGSSEHQGKALTRCKQTRQLLGDFIYKEFDAWTTSMENCYELTSGAVFHKVILMRHFHRADWIQTNMDQLVLPALESAECWDRLLLEIPQVFQPLWQERHELRAAFELVSTLVYLHNSVLSGLTQSAREESRDLVVKLNLALEPGLYGIAWSQGSFIKKFVSSCTVILEEIVREMNPFSAGV